MRSFHILHLVLVGQKAEKETFQDVGTEVLALALSHAGTSPGRGACSGLNPLLLLPVSIKEEL